MFKNLWKWWKAEARAGSPRTRPTVRPRLEALEHRTVLSAVVTGLSPNIGPTTGPTGMAVFGSGFTGASAVRFGATPALGFFVISDTMIETWAPPESAGVVDVTVTTPAGTTPTSPADEYTYSLAASTTSLTSSGNPVGAGGSVTFTATVAGADLGTPAAPTGTVQFEDGGAVLGTGTLAPGMMGVQATFTTSALAAGAHVITAVYGGDGAFAASVSGVLNVTIVDPTEVTNLNDAGPGSLRAAIIAANAMGSSPGIEFLSGLTGTIRLETALPDLTSNIAVVGPGSNEITVERDPSAMTTFRIFTIDAGMTCGISGLTITGGIADGSADSNGGGILNRGDLWLRNDTIWNDVASNGGRGGGVANLPSASLTVDGCTFALCTADGEGGGISNEGFLDLYGQTNIFSNGADYGGGLWNGPGATVSVSGGTDIYGNTAAMQGGGVYNLGSFTMTDGQVQDNATLRGSGGGFFNGQGGVATLTRVSVTGNSAHTGGGGFALAAGSRLNLDSCTISDNSAVVGEGIAFTQGANYTLDNCTVTDPIARV